LTTVIVNSRRVYEISPPSLQPTEMGYNPKPREFIPYPSFYYYEDLFWRADIVLDLVSIPTF